MSDERDRTSKEKTAVEESNTSLGEDLPVAGKTRVGKFTGRRRL
jgi:hypothetical protein